MNQPAPAPRRAFPERWRGWPREFWDPLGEFTQLLNRLGQHRSGLEGWIPAVETEETDDSYVIRAELPGMKRDDIDIELRGNELRITGEVTEDKSGQTLRLRHGKFAYGATLPTDVDADQADAQLNDGVLTVRLPKATQAQTRKVEIKD